MIIIHLLEMLQNNTQEVQDSSIYNQYGLKFSNIVSCSTAEPKLSRNTSSKSNQLSVPKKRFHVTLKKLTYFQTLKPSYTKNRRKNGISLSRSLNKKIDFLYQSQDFSDHQLRIKGQVQIRKSSLKCQPRQQPVQFSMKSISLVKQPNISLDQQTYYTGKRSSKIQTSSKLSIQAKQNTPTQQQVNSQKRKSKFQLQRLNFLRKNHQETYLTIEEYFPSKIQNIDNQNTVNREWLSSIDPNTKGQIFTPIQKKHFKRNSDDQSLKQQSIVKQKVSNYRLNLFRPRNSDKKNIKSTENIQFSKTKNRKSSRTKSGWQVISSLEHATVFQSVNFGID